MQRRHTLCQVTVTVTPSSMSSRAARSLLGPLVDGYRDLETSKQGFNLPNVSPLYLYLLS